MEGIGGKVGGGGGSSARYWLLSKKGKKLINLVMALREDKVSLKGKTRRKRTIAGGRQSQVIRLKKHRKGLRGDTSGRKQSEKFKGPQGISCEQKWVTKEGLPVSGQLRKQKRGSSQAKDGRIREGELKKLRKNERVVKIRVTDPETWEKT